MHRSDIPDLRAKELLTVVTLAEYGSFVAAAAHLKTSQPALTRTVKRVERVLGVMLFARNTRKVEITPAGREFVAVAERVLDDLQLTVRNLDEVTREQRGRVTVSTYSAFAINPMPYLIRSYRETRPLVEVRIREGRQLEIVEDVRSGAADFGIGYANSLPDILESTVLSTEPLYAIVPGSHRLAGAKRTKIALAELRGEPLVSGPSESYLRRMLDGAAAASGFTMNYVVTVDRLLSVMHHVCAGVGVGVLAEGCLPPMQWGEGFQALLITDPPLAVQIGLLTLRGRYLTPASAGLASLIRQRAGKRVPETTKSCSPVPAAAVGS
ncbi:MAG TPA: LysR family transcriptional regulator [Vicinamibacterales bacterium]|jgi:DNA-binding transcriptional LysR family regulator|nr:LysR family transcriptional regulator [Vicinamibacterales bacterium]